jgi:subfamily B ATP-binding cassette protein MsbA
MAKQRTSKRLFGFVIQEKKYIILGVVATLLMSVVELFTGSLLKFLTNLVDRFSGSFAEGFSETIKIPVKYHVKLPLLNEKVSIIHTQLKGKEDVLHGMLMLCLFFVGLYFFLALFNYLRRVFMNMATQGILRRFKTTIYRKILKLPYAFFDRNKTGDVVSRITYDVTTLSEIIDLLIEVARASIYVVVFVPVMFLLSWELSLFTILFFPLSAWVVHKITRYIKVVSRQITDNVGDYTAFLEDRINKFSLIKGYGLENKEGRAFEEKVDENYRFNIRLVKLKFLLNPLNDFMAMIGLAVVFIVYSFQLTSGNTTLGDIVFFLYLVKTAYKPVKKVAQAWGQLHVALVSTRKIFHLMDEEEEKRPMPLSPLLENINSIGFKGIGFAYPNDGKQVLKDISFEANKGEVIAVAGKTGAGKSTLLGLLPMFHKANEGEILINGKTIDSISLEFVRSKVKYVGAAEITVDGSIYENIILNGDEFPKDKEKEIIDFLGLNSVAELSKIIGKDGADLSMGQKQKVAFLRAILTKPDVLILDEVFTSLDNEDIQTIFEWSKQTPIVFVVSRKTEVQQYISKKLTICDGSLH